MSLEFGPFPLEDLPLTPPADSVQLGDSSALVNLQRFRSGPSVRQCVRVEPFCPSSIDGHSDKGSRIRQSCDNAVPMPDTRTVGTVAVVEVGVSETNLVRLSLCCRNKQGWIGCVAMLKVLLQSPSNGQFLPKLLQMITSWC